MFIHAFTTYLKEFIKENSSRSSSSSRSRPSSSSRPSSRSSSTPSLSFRPSSSPRSSKKKTQNGGIGTIIVGIIIGIVVLIGIFDLMDNKNLSEDDKEKFRLLKGSMLLR
jgi:hypothetical protein